MKLTDYSAEATQRVLITGLPGSGKSTLAAALAEYFHLIWIDAENGADTLTKLPKKQQENITLIHLPDSAAYPIAADTCAYLFRNGKANICDEHGKNECAICKKAGASFEQLDFSKLTGNDIVVVDTITQVSHSVLAHLMRGKPIDAKPERDDWGGLRKHTEFLASQWQAAPYNLICIAHVIETVLEDGKTKLVPNFGSASMSAEIAKFFGHVIYCDVKNGKHVAGSSTKYSNSILTKSRTDFCIEKLPVPSLVPLFQNTQMAVPNLEPVVVDTIVTGTETLTVISTPNVVVTPTIIPAIPTTTNGEKAMSLLEKMKAKGIV